MIKKKNVMISVTFDNDGNCDSDMTVIVVVMIKAIMMVGIIIKIIVIAMIIVMMNISYDDIDEGNNILLLKTMLTIVYRNIH